MKDPNSVVKNVIPTHTCREGICRIIFVIKASETITEALNYLRTRILCDVTKKYEK